MKEVTMAKEIMVLEEKVVGLSCSTDCQRGDPLEQNKRGRHQPS
jgi:hypothetical protein